MTLLLLIALGVELGAIAMLAVEIRSPESNIRNASDALWYIYVSITTVGYGDRYPVTDWGRVIGAIVLTMGVGLYGTLTAFLANFFLGVRQEVQASQAETPAANAESSQPQE
jgi:voltage-gated potassium channel